MARPARTRQPIMDAALRLFVERGVHATGVRDIAEAAGCSEAALYRHWGGKDELVTGLFRQHLGDVVEALEQAFARRGDAAARIRAAVQAAYAIYDANPHVFRFVLVVQHELGPYLPDDVRMPNHVIRAFVDDLVASGEAEGEPELLTAALVGTFIEASSRVIYGHLPGPMGRHAEAVAALASRLLKP